MASERDAARRASSRDAEEAYHGVEQPEAWCLPDSQMSVRSLRMVAAIRNASVCHRLKRRAERNVPASVEIGAKVRLFRDHRPSSQRSTGGPAFIRRRASRLRRGAPFARNSRISGDSRQDQALIRRPGARRVSRTCPQLLAPVPTRDPMTTPSPTTRSSHDVMENSLQCAAENDTMGHARGSRR